MTTTDPLLAGTHDVDIDGVSLRYTVAGTGPVCLMHAGGPGVSPHYLRMPEVERHVTAVYLDPLGTGGSGRLPTHPRGYTMDLYLACVEKVLGHLGQESALFLGHSFGGFVAQDLALRRPDLLTGLILYDTGPAAGPDLAAEAAKNVEEFAARFPGHPALPDVLAAFQADPGPDATDEASTRALQGIVPLYFAHYWAREDEFGPAARSLTVTNVAGDEEPVDFRGRLHEISAPTLILVGRYDWIASPRWAQELHRDIPGSRLVTFEHSGHLPHVEEPELFAAAIGEFVSDIER